MEGLRGRVAMRMDLVLRFGYGGVIPWVHRVDGALLATGGPHTAQVRSAVDTHGEGFRTVAEFTVARGQRLPFVITFFPSHETPPLPIDPFAAQAATQRAWDQWCGQCAYDGKWRDAVLRSLITLKSLTYAPTGGIVAAPTTSLPERIGGSRNWDYRFCWVRDSTFTLYALLLAGYRDEAAAWREWLLRSAAGRPRRPADAIRRRRRSGTHGIRSPLAAGLREFAAGARRQRRIGPGAARRLRRIDRCPVPRPPCRPRAQRRRVALRSRAPQVPRAQLESSPTMASGRRGARSATSRTRK